LKLLGVHIESSSRELDLITDWMDYGSLGDIIYLHQITLSLEQILCFSIQIAQGLLYVHTSGFIHRDVKAANILVNSQGTTKVGDFGLAIPASLPHNKRRGSGSLRWLAPEAFKDEPYNEKVDVFSFGNVLLEISSNSQPFSQLTPKEAVRLSALQGMRPPLPPHIPEDLRTLISLCWHADPSIRPSFSIVIESLRRIATANCKLQT